MAGRVKFCVLFTICLGASQSLPAQGPTRFAHASREQGAVQFSSYENNWVGGGPSPAGMPMGQPAPIETQSGVGYVDHDGIVVTRSELEEDNGELLETPLEQAIRRGIRSSWVQVDYLNWSIGDVGGTTPDYDLSEIGLHGINGVQTTIGLPMTFGSFEMSGFLLEQASDAVVASNFVGAGGSFNSRFTSDIWGADLNFIMDPYLPGEGFKLRPMGGFRYFAIQESLKLPGETAPGALWAKSETFNNVLAPQLGIRAELVHRWFTIGAEPKVGFGTNIVRTEIRDKGLLGGSPLRDNETETSFAPFGDFDVYAHIPCGEHFTFFVSYNLVLMAGVSRPFDNLAFNATDNIHQAFSTRGFRLEGYSVGGQIIF